MSRAPFREARAVAQEIATQVAGIAEDASIQRTLDRGGDARSIVRQALEAALMAADDAGLDAAHCLRRAILRVQFMGSDEHRARMRVLAQQTRAMDA